MQAFKYTDAKTQAAAKKHAKEDAFKLCVEHGVGKPTHHTLL